MGATIKDRWPSDQCLMGRTDHYHLRKSVPQTDHKLLDKKCEIFGVENRSLQLQVRFTCENKNALVLKTENPQ